jgi:fused signal recognition particle receptor
MFGFLKTKDDPAAPAAAPPAATRASWGERLKAGLSRTRDTLNTPLTELFSRAKIDDELLEDLETTLLMADCGVEATNWLLAELKAAVKREKLETPAQLRAALAGSLQTLLAPLEQALDAHGQNPFVIMIAGVNGAGKTTSIGKLAKHFQSQGKTVLLAAGDTFRAAAREQLSTWGERNGVTVIAQESGDPAAVVFDAINAARARKIDVVLADTAGRLPTQLHLMEEIAKVRRVMQKVDASARGAAGARRQHRAERRAAGQGLRQGDRRHRTGDHQARRHRQGRRAGRHRAPVPEAGALHRCRRRHR